MTKEEIREFAQDLTDFMVASLMCGATSAQAIDSTFGHFYKKGKPVLRQARARLSWNAWAPIREEVFKRDGYICAYCGDEDGPHEVDHIRPIKRGGGNDLDNLCVACRPCNVSKNNRLPSEWEGRRQ